MIKWADIPTIYKAGAVVVAMTAFTMSYHDQFVTIADAAEAQSKAKDEIRLLRVDGYETEKRALVREKKKAVEQDKPADAEQLEQEIKDLRAKIKGLCDKLDDC